MLQNCTNLCADIKASQWYALLKFEGDLGKDAKTVPCLPTYSSTTEDW